MSAPIIRVENDKDRPCAPTRVVLEFPSAKMVAIGLADELIQSNTALRLYLAKAIEETVGRARIVRTARRSKKRS